MEQNKIAILGASYLQKPLIVKAKELGLETHVFAWRDGNVVEDICDHYYDISIIDRQNILEKCVTIGIDGIISIASDIAMPTVNYIANELGLVGNSLDSALKSTDKYEMRKALTNAGIKCPHYNVYNLDNFLEESKFSLPVIVKPTDRSGSLGVTMVEDYSKINSALDKAISYSLSKKAIVEEYIHGREFSVEGISINGHHQILAITEKVTTGPPHFVEIAHHQPAQITVDIKQQITAFTKDVLRALGITHGASHTEIILSPDGDLTVVESAGRMGGDWIGTHITPATTGFDYLMAVLLISMGKQDLSSCMALPKFGYAGVYYISTSQGIINSITVNTSKYNEISDWYLILKENDQIDYILDGSNRRAAVIFYKSDKGKLILDPSEAIKYNLI